MKPIARCQNPWTELPCESPFVLAQDAAAIQKFNVDASPDKRFELSLYPEPFFGVPDAPVVLLALNPGVSSDDFSIHQGEVFARQSRASLTHSLQPYPFLHLHPDASTPGSFWWKRICRTLIEEVGFESVAHGILSLEFFPYHSKFFGSHSLKIPSQQYGFDLLRSALARDAEVVVMRSGEMWMKAVPTLSGYARLHRVRNPRNPTLSPKNLGDAAFASICSRLRSGV